MRALWIAMATAGLVGGLAIAAEARWQQQNDPKWIFDSFRPSQSGVDHDTPTDPEAIAACKVEQVFDDQKRPIGIAVRDGQGQLLRKFIDAVGAKQVDQWSYFKDGFEVYRDVDFNDDLKIDEARWLNSGGTRIGVIQDGKIRSWRRLSAEEASKVLVQALVAGDLNLLETVMATPEELEGLGLPEGLVEQARKDKGDRKAQVDDLIKSLAGWERSTAWFRFDGVHPHVVPADAAKGLKEDIVLYENAAVLATPADGQGDLSRMAYLQAPEIVKLGDVWKFVGLPRGIDPSNPVVASFDGVRSWVYREAGSVVSPTNPEMEQTLTALADHDARAMEVLTAGDPKAMASYYYDRAQILRKVVEAAPASERLVYEKEIVNSLAAAYQSGEYPDGLKGLDRLIEAGGPLASYAAFRKVLADYALKASDPDKIVEAQEAWVAGLETFLSDYPDAEEVPDAMLQLASVNEFNGDEQEARTYYERLAREYPGTEAGQKAAGAMKRLNLVGQTIDLKGPALDGSTVDSAAAKGKNLLVVFWTTGADSFRRELPELVRTYKQNAGELEIIGVCLDGDKAIVEEFLARNPVPWKTIFESGGSEGRLANEYGVISLPTMFLADPQGKVVDRNLRTALDVEKLVEQALARNPGED
ncbi:TlpA disulfide reductase family protein [soil metagenome]